MDGLLNPDDPLERQRDKLLNICTALMRRVEQTPNDQSNAYAQFERAALLDAQVRERTRDLEHALDLLNESNAKLSEASREAEQSRALLNEAIESVDEGFAFFDSSENLVLFNSRFCEDLADVPGQLVPGTSFSQFVEIVSRSEELHLPPGETPQDWARQRLLRHREERVVFNIALTKDRWMQVSEHRTGQGGTAILQTNITDVMRAQHRERAQLVDSQHKMLRATLDHLAQGVCIFDEDARLVGWNRKLSRMFGLPVRYIRTGTRFSRILEFLRGRMTFEEPRSSDWLEDWSQSTSKRKPIDFGLADRTGRIFNVFAQEMPDRGFVMSFTDVTAEHQAAENLRNLNRTLEQRVSERTQELGEALQVAERANETKSRFVAAASHDLLQPLSAAKLYLATLQDLKCGDEVAGISQKAGSALKSAEDIIEALLDISKLDAGQATFDVQPFSLSQVLNSLTNEMTPIAREKGLSLTIVPSSAMVVSDPVFFRRILQNLISNAIRYTDAGRVLVGARRGAGGAVRIDVHDTGRGIAARDHKRIFQEFARLEDSHSGANGIGLGLAIVERACSSLGHELNLRSAVGKGSCFSIGVTRHVGEHRIAVPTDRRATAFDAVVGKLILLVENDPNLAHAMKLMLENSGAHVVHTPTAEKALSLMEEIELVPDAMLFDQQLGAGMTGLDLCKTIRNSHGLVPTFVMSASRDPNLEQMCEAMDVPFLRKPIDAEKLMHALNAACS